MRTEVREGLWQGHWLAQGTGGDRLSINSSETTDNRFLECGVYHNAGGEPLSQNNPEIIPVGSG